MKYIQKNNWGGSVLISETLSTNVDSIFSFLLFPNTNSYLYSRYQPSHFLSEDITAIINLDMDTTLRTTKLGG